MTACGEHPSLADLRNAILAKRRRGREAIAKFVESARNEDIGTMGTRWRLLRPGMAHQPQEGAL